MSMFGQIGRTQYLAPDYSQGLDNSAVNDLMQYKRSQEDRQLQMQKDLMSLQHQNRMQELAASQVKPHVNPPMSGDRYNPYGGGSAGGANVVFKDYLDPYKLAQLSQGERKLDIAAANNQARNDVAQQRANTYDTIANQPNVIELHTKGGNKYLVDRKTGQIVDTGVASGTMTDADRLQQTGQNAINLENTREGNRETLEGKRQEGRQANIKSRGENAIRSIQEQGNQTRITNVSPKSNAAANVPSQQKIAAQNRAAEFMNANPKLKDFIQIDPNTGQVNVMSPGSGGMFGNAPNEQEYEQIMDAIYPGGLGGMAPQLGGTQGKVRVQAPDGRTGTWDMSKGPVPKNFKLVQ